MATRHKLWAVALAALVGLAGAWGGPARAADATPATAAGDAPTPARGRGDKCQMPTEWMRRNHMWALKHKRDETVHEGVRTPQFSLKACMDCHAVKGADGQPVSVENPQHFCRTCHDYAAVSIDCFECHASKPGEPGKSARLGLPDAVSGASETAALAQYVAGHDKGHER